MLKWSTAAVAAAAASLMAAAPAAAERVVTMRGYDAPGPARYDKVKVIQVGPKKAEDVLVLVPGTSASAAYFLPLAEDLVEQLPGWQVWSVERRENLLEDHSVLSRAVRGEIGVQALFDYYLGWIGNEAGDPHFQPVSDDQAAWAREWGMEVAIQDLRRVVKAAGKGGRRVTLGGHSLGASITAAYATWDFGRRAGAGARDLSGMVLIDGGSYGGTPPTPAEAQASLEELETTSPFLDLTGLGLPWSAGVFNAVGSTGVLLEPDVASIMQPWPFLPDALKPPVRATAKAQYGFALDVSSGPENLALVQMHIGHLADSGDPRGWVDDGLVPVMRAARVFSGIPGMDGTAWYHPRRLSIDSRAINGGIANDAQKTLDVHATRGRELGRRMPIYAFETSLGKGRVLAGARALARQSRVRPRFVKLVGRSGSTAHMDPVAAPTETNAFIKTVVPFLKRKVR